MTRKAKTRDESEDKGETTVSKIKDTNDRCEAMPAWKTPDQLARSADMTAETLFSEFMRHTRLAATFSIDARIANNAPDETAWDEYAALREQADLHKACRDELHQALAAYIIDGDDPAEALAASQKA